LTYGGNYGGKEYAAYGYDSVWVIAYALNQTANTLENISRTLNDFTYDSKDIADIIFLSVNKTNITGVTVSK
jgi:ABC-type branched-subunit amino acid transport system substrate-binding protein